MENKTANGWVSVPMIEITQKDSLISPVFADSIGRYGFKIHSLEGFWQHVGTDTETGKEAILQLNEGLFEKYKGYQLISSFDLEKYKYW